MAPLLEELASYTVLGPTLRNRKIDVDHMIDSTEGLTVGDLLDRVRGWLAGTADPSCFENPRAAPAAE